MTRPPLPAHIGTESVQHGYGFGYRGTCACGWRGEERPMRGRALFDATIHADDCDHEAAADRRLREVRD